MIVTVSDESNYLLNVTKYMVLSLSKYMPKEKLSLIIVNGTGKYDNEIQNWHPNLLIKHYEIEDDNNKGLYFAFMALPLYDLLMEYEESLIYIDGDVIIRQSLSALFDDLTDYDVMVRYRPYLDFIGPMGTIYGARTNTGILALSNNQRVKEFIKDFKDRIITFIQEGNNPIVWNKEKTSLTGVDQELMWILIDEYKDSINFSPLDDRFNDSFFKDDSIIWHAKGITRTYPEYLIECYKYGRKDINILKEYIILYYRKFKDFVKSFLIEPKESFYIKELADIFKSINVKSIIVVNSNFYLDNEDLLKDRDIKCYDTDPAIYYKNKTILDDKKINHKYIVYDTQTINSDNIDLLIYEQKNVKVISTFNYVTTIVKD